MAHANAARAVCRMYMEVGAMVVDPVCGRKIKEDEALCRVFYGGRTYFFCSDDCARKFSEDPENFISNFGKI